MSLSSPFEPKTLTSLRQFAIAIIEEKRPAHKVLLARQAADLWAKGALPAYCRLEKPLLPLSPGRPERPQLLPPRKMPKRKASSRSGLIALIHALVHIELNAIDMAFDLIARWCDAGLPPDFLHEAVRIGLEEAQHFTMINKRLEELGAGYGDLPAHGNLWEAVCDTRHDLLARLTLVPLILEARGLDVSPKMMAQLKAQGNTEMAATMEIIYREEITHVAFGVKWFTFLCEQRGLVPQQQFQTLAKKYFKGTLQPPFNKKARQMAGLKEEFYQNLTETGEI